jgi:hypothetical protein
MQAQTTAALAAAPAGFTAQPTISVSCSVSDRIYSLGSPTGFPTYIPLPQPDVDSAIQDSIISLLQTTVPASSAKRGIHSLLPYNFVGRGDKWTRLDPRHVFWADHFIGIRAIMNDQKYLASW